MAGTLTKLAGVQLATVLECASLPQEARVPLLGCTDIADAIDRLEGAGLATEATRVLAHALPKREGVWWACMCAASNAPPDLAEPDRLARETAELWVRQQKDEQRRAAMAHAEASGFMTPEAWSGVAAFWSGDSMAPLGQAAVPPLPYLTGTAVSGAVTLAAVRGDGKRHAARLKRFLESGRNIAAGGPGRIPLETP
jgi:hypothetical protein